MLRQRLPRLPKALKGICAYALYKRKAWSKKRKRWLYIYAIYPPPAKPFLPSDEALETMVGHLPEIGFMGSNRFPDRDVFFVFGLKRSLFSRRADLSSRVLRRKFLCSIGQGATAERGIRMAVREVAEKFITQNGSRRIEWNGKRIIETTKNDMRRESHLRSKCLPEFKELYRACKTELPFFFEAAH